MDSEYISLGQAARQCPGTNGRPHPHPSAVFRWCRHGLLSRSGRRVRLKHVRCGRGLFTTVEWLHRFFCELAEADLGYFRDEDPHRRDVARAEAELDAAGF